MFDAAPDYTFLVTPTTWRFAMCVLARDWESARPSSSLNRE
jgi:hypothetical protein